ncbi:protein artichoke-like [Prorops nasuta]|uniref:protein artichoke-like n=1 Tax=Prorops nasuta TaxID=863751 RepID=UPI0034CF9D33
MTANLIVKGKPKDEPDCTVSSEGKFIYINTKIVQSGAHFIQIYIAIENKACVNRSIILSYLSKAIKRDFLPIYNKKMNLEILSLFLLKRLSRFYSQQRIISIIIISLLMVLVASDDELDFDNDFLINIPTCVDEESNVTLRFANTVISTIGDNFISSPTVTCVDLSENKISSISKGAFDEAPNLKYLNLAGNSIDYTSLLPILNSHSKLETLILDSQQNSVCNQMDMSEMSYIFPKLKFLSMRFSAIRSIWNIRKSPARDECYYYTDCCIFIDITYPELLYIDISNSEFIDIGFINQFSCSKLEYLDVSNNNIETINIDYHNNLIQIKADNNNINYISYRSRNDSTGAIYLNGMKKLKHLSLSNNALDRIDPYAFRDTKELVSLILNDNRLQYIADNAFDSLNSLKVLKLNNNMLTVIPLINADMKLTELSFDNNQLLNLTKNSFSSMPLLKNLSLKNNSISIVEDDAFTRLNLLEKLDISLNMIGKLPLDWNLNLYNLKYLDLSSNSFTSLEALSLSETTNVIELDLRYNHIKSVNAHTCDTFPENITIILLDYMALHSLLKVYRTDSFSLSPKCISPFIIKRSKKYEPRKYNRFQHIPLQNQVSYKCYSFTYNKNRKILITDYCNLFPFSTQIHIALCVGESADSHMMELRLESRLVRRSATLNWRYFTKDCTHPSASVYLLDIKRNPTEYSFYTETEKAYRYIYSKKGIITLIITSLLMALVASVEKHELEDNFKINIPSCADEQTNVTLRFANTVISTIGDNFISSPTVTCVDLSENKISSISTGAFDEMPNLKYLNLAGNEIVKDKLLPILNSHPKLEKLIVDSQISGGCRYTRNLNTSYVFSKLKFLSMKNNKVFAIYNNDNRACDVAEYDEYYYGTPCCIYVNIICPELIYLDISNNEFNEIEFINSLNCQNLTFLNVSDNRIDTIKFNYNKNLEHLSADYNKIKYLAYKTRNDNKGAIYLNGMRKLKHLSLSNNQLERIDSYALRDTKELVSLILNDNRLQYIADNAFDSLNNLKVLKLSNNKLTVIPLINADIKLSELNIDNNLILNLTKNSFNSMPFLKSLSLQGNNISFIEEEAFAGLTLLEKLDLSVNKLSKLPFDWSLNLYNLHHLNLSTNSFTSLEALSLSETTNIIDLDLRKNHIKSVIAHTCDTFPENITIILSD